MHVFSREVVGFWALTFREKRHQKELSPKLRNLLAKMIQNVPVVRASFEDILGLAVYENALNAKKLNFNCFCKAFQ